MGKGMQASARKGPKTLRPQYALKKKSVPNASQPRSLCKQLVWTCLYWATVCGHNNFEASVAVIGVVRDPTATRRTPRPRFTSPLQYDYDVSSSRARLCKLRDDKRKYVTWEPKNEG